MGRLAVLIHRQARAVVIIGAVLAAVTGWSAWFHLHFSGDRAQVLVSDAPYFRTLTEWHRDFHAQDAIFFVITGPNIDANRAAALDLGGRVRQDSSHFNFVLDRIDLTFVRERMLLFLPVDQLRAIVSRLEDSRYLLDNLLKHPSVPELFASINDRVQDLIQQQINISSTPPPSELSSRGGKRPRPTNSAERTRFDQLAQALPMLGQIMDNLADALGKKFVYRSPLATLLDGHGAGKSASATNSARLTLPEDMWIQFDDGRTILVSAEPVYPPDEDRSLAQQAAVFAARHLMTLTHDKYPMVHLDLTGMPVIGSDEMHVAEDDSTRATLLSLFGITLLFFVAYRRFGRPVLAMICLLAALVYTLGFMAVTVGHLNVLTVTAMPMLVGLGIDFGIQVISRYEEERTANGHDAVTAMYEMMQNTGASILTAGLTTSVSFAVTGLSGFSGVKELGVLAGGGIVISTVVMLVLLPAVVLLCEGWRPGDLPAMRRKVWDFLKRAEHAALARPGWVLCAASLMTLICAIRVWDVQFDWNVLDLQDRHSPAVETAITLLQKNNRSIVNAALIADDLPQAQQLQQRLSQLSMVANVTSIAMLMPPDQDEKVGYVRQLQAFFHTLPPPPSGPAPPMDVPLLVSAVSGLRSASLLAFPTAEQEGGKKVGNALEQFVADADSLLIKISDRTNIAQRRLDRYQRDFYGDLFGKIALIESPQAAVPLTYSALPDIVRHEFVGDSGKLLVSVFPSGSVWDRPDMEMFLDAVESVARQTPSASGKLPQVTGSVVQIYESTKEAITGYERIAVYALVAIVVLVLLHFRHIGTSLLALTPLGLGLLWMFGIQAIAGVAFNVINMLALPLILGIGVANGIYVVRRFDEEGTASIFTRSTGRAILLSNLAAIIGFGSLLVSRYQAMFSFGLLMALGVAMCMVSSLVVLPAMLTLVAARRAHRVSLQPSV